MGSLLRIFTSVFAGMMLAAVNFAPVVEVERFMSNRRRVVYALVLGVLSVTFFIAATLLTVIDLVIQFEKQSYLNWNGLLTAAIVLWVGSVGLLIAARATLPGVKDFLIRTTPEELLGSLLRLLRPLLNTFHLEGLIQHLAKATAPATAPPAATTTELP